MPDPKNTKTKDTLYTWNGRQVNKQFSDSINFQKNYSDKMFNKGEKIYQNAEAFSKERDMGFDLMKRSVKLKPGPGTLKKKFEGGEQITTYNMKPKNSKSKAGDVEIKSPFPFTKEGLDKLPDDIPGKFGDIVRKEKAEPANEMKGYQMSYKMVNKQGLKMAGNPAYKFHEPGHNEFEVGDFGNLGDEYKQISAINTEPIYESLTSKYTGPLMPNDEWAALSPEKRREMNAAVGADEKGDITKNILSGYNTLISTKSIPQPGTPEVKGDAFTAYDRRQEGRQGKILTGQSIRNENKIRRAEKRIDKLQTKGRENADITDPEFLKKQKKLQDKINKTNIRKKNLEERQEGINISKSNFRKQQEQGVNPDVGRRNKVTLQEGKEGSSTTGSKLNAIKFKDFVSGKKSGNVTFEMKLPANAMNYFNKKLKK